MAQYEEDYSRLLSQELPYYREAGTCGGCGSSADAAGDAEWVDFQSYIQWKAIARQLTGYRASARPAYWEAMHGPMPTNDVETDDSNKGVMLSALEKGK
jgi:hypothetical protein